MRDDICVIIQGPTDYIDVVLTHTTYPNYLISTWNPSLPSLANKNAFIMTIQVFQVQCISTIKKCQLYMV